MPRRLDPLCRSLRRLALATAVCAVAGTGGCDEKLQNQLKNASARQTARDAKKAEAEALRARGIGPAPAVSPEIARAIKVVRMSDYDFMVRKKGAGRKKKGDDPPKRHNGFDFASTLESKTRWLGRGVNDLPTWLDEIGSSTFFAGDEYVVRLPDGREMSFRAWLLEELAALPPDLTPDLVPEPDAAPDAAAPTTTADTPPNIPPGAATPTAATPAKTPPTTPPGAAPPTATTPAKTPPTTPPVLPAAGKPAKP